MRFELVARDGAARVGKLETPHGTVATPALLPVVHPGRQGIAPRAMAEQFGAQMVITNAYITWRTPGLREAALAKGIRGMLDFPGPVMTDSGTFQMYFYGKTLEVDNATIVGFQRDIQSTVGTILDLFATPDMTREATAACVDETLVRARAAQAHKGGMELALPVQGGLFEDLRERCAREMGQMDAGIHPIGGVVPLMEGQRYADLVQVIAASQRGLPRGRPVHLFGAGHPMMFALAALLGCDLVDSASYSKFAQDGRLLLSDGTVHLEELEELPCGCPVCSATTARELKALDPGPREDALARHNLHVSLAEMRRVREAIRQGRLWELAERRCRSHPALLDALRAVAGHGAWLERHEPVSRRSALFYTGPETLDRPAVQRLRTRLVERYESPCAAAVVLEPRERPFSRGAEDVWARARAAGVQVLAKTFLGAVPLELDQMYPVTQCAEPSRWDRSAGKGFTRHLDAMLAAHAWKLLTVEEVQALPSPRDAPDLDAARVTATAQMQFGRAGAAALLAGGLEFRKSRRTGRVRNVLAAGEHVFSLRASDGLGSLRLAGARRLHQGVEAPGHRVVVRDDAVPFAREGRNVFARFVAAMDPALRPGDACVVVDADDGLLAAGAIGLQAEEAASFQRGVAVEVREGVAGKAPEDPDEAGRDGSVS